MTVREAHDEARIAGTYMEAVNPAATTVFS
jgi:hypothetical protein